jgi:hypothetical protein
VEFGGEAAVGGAGEGWSGLGDGLGAARVGDGLEGVGGTGVPGIRAHVGSFRLQVAGCRLKAGNQGEKRF